MDAKDFAWSDSFQFALVPDQLVRRKSFFRRLVATGSALVFLMAADSVTQAAPRPASIQFQAPVPVVAPASPANSFGPFGLAMDKVGDLFVADFNNNRVVEIPAGCTSTTCQVTVPTSGLSGPTGLTVDGSGNVFIADYNNNRVVEVPRASGGYGAQIALPNTGQDEPGSVAVDAAGDVFIANFDHSGATASRVVELPWTGTAFGSPITVVNWLTGPFGLQFDLSGNLFVVDQGSGQIVELPPGCTSNSCQIIAASGLPLSPGPTAVAIDHAGDLFVADGELVEIPKGCLSASCQASVGYSLNVGLGVLGVVVDSTGNIFAADYGKNQLLEIRQNSFDLGSVALGSTANLTAYVNFDSTLTLSSTDPYSLLTQGGSGMDFVDARGGSCTATTYNTGQSCSIQIQFKPQFAGSVSGALSLFDTGGDNVATAYLSGVGTGPQVTFLPATESSVGVGLVSSPGVAVDRQGNLFVADQTNRTVEELLAPTYTTARSLGGSFNFTNPVGLAVDGAGNVFVADTGSTAIEELVAPAYTTVNMVGSGFSRPSGVAVDGIGNVFVADTGTNSVKEILEASGYTSVVTLASSFNAPAAVAVDVAGNVYVTDTGNNEVKEILAVGGSVPATPTINTLGSGFSAPAGVAVDNIGNVYVADTGNDAVEELTAASGFAVKSTLGNSFAAPSGVAVDKIGNVYVGSPANGQITKLDFADAPTLSFQAAAGTTSSPQTVTVTDYGNADLTFASPASGYNPNVSSNFNLQATESGGSPCPILSPSLGSATLAAGASCVDQLTFHPSIAGTFSGSMVITDNTLNVSGSAQSIVLSGTSVAMTFAPSSLTSAQVGTAYNQTISASGGTAPYAYQLTAGALPAGLALGSAGLLSGTPSAAGSFMFTVNATDANNLSGSQAYTLTVGAPTIMVSPASLPDPQVNVAYSQALTASGGTAPYAFKLTGGSLPAGLTLSSAGILSGTPTATGSFSFTVSATDNSTGSGAPFSGTVSYSFNVNPPDITIAPSVLPSGQVGAAYTLVSLTASGGTGPYSYNVSAGQLPSGLSLSSAGLMSGTPTSVGSFSFTVSATDTNGATGSQAYSVTINPPSITLTPASLPAAQVNVAYSQTLVATGGTAPYTYKMTSGSLPAGLTLSNAGVLSGAPTANGSFAFAVSATDSSTGSGAPFSGSVSYTLIVNAPNITISPTTLPAGQVGGAYTLVSLSASGGNAPYSYKVTSGSLAGGLNLSSSGVLSGTPTAGGSFTFTVTATDAANFTGSQTFSITVSAPTITIVPGALSAGQVQVGYIQTLTASGGTAPYSFQLTGALPAGVSFNAATGTFSGTPTAGGSFPIAVSVTDSSTGAGPYTSSANYTLAVNPGTALVTFAAISPQTYGDPPFTVTASSASNGAITYSIVSGEATINSTSGLVTLLGAGQVTIEATQAATASYNSTIAQMPISVARQSSVTSLTASSTSAAAGQNVTLTAAVAPAVMGTPTGTITFFDGGAQLGSAVTLTNGTAQLVTSNLTAGTNNISAVYSGDSNYLESAASLSSPVLVSPPGFSFTATGNASQDVMPGGAATFAFALTPSATDYPGTVTFTVEGLPSGASGIMSPTSVSSTAGSQTITLKIQSSSNSGALSPLRSDRRPYTPVALAAFLPLLFVRKLRLKGRKALGVMMLMILLACGTFSILSISGCGAVSGMLGQSYSVAVTATSGTTQHTAFVNLIVK